VPIVFANVTDPVAAGFVESLARPGGNATGFTLFEYGISAKWLELLKEVAPGVARAAVIREGTNPAGIGQFAAIQAVAPSHGVQVSSVVVRDGSEIERAVGTLAQSPNGGLIVTASGLKDSDGHLIVTLAARYRLPAVYPFPSFVTDGGCARAASGHAAAAPPSSVMNSRRFIGYPQGQRSRTTIAGSGPCITAKAAAQ
jgi:putative tryptophan/tyrosine transport system substrate-binding protein